MSYYDPDDEDIFKTVLLVVALVIFGLCLICSPSLRKDVKEELNAPVPMWLYLLNS